MHFSADDARSLTPILQRRILRLFQRRGLLEAHTGFAAFPEE